MDISDVRVKLIQDSGDRLKAVCTVTFDECFVVRDVKVVEGTNGLFVAMPSRKVSAHCPKCRQKNHLRAMFCNHCGKKLPPQKPMPESDGRSRMHKDLAHPITAEFRETVQTKVIAAYETEFEENGVPVAEEPPKRERRERRDRADKAPTREDRTEKQPARHERMDAEPESREDFDDERDKMDDIQPLAVSEYDALIADLRKSSGASSRREDSGGAPPRDRGDRGGRRDRRVEPVEEADEDESAEAPEPVKPEPADDEEAGFASELEVADDEEEVTETREAPAATARRESKPSRRKEPKPEPEPVSDAFDDDEGGFGEGIL